MRTCMFTNTPDEHFVIDRLPDTPEILVVSACSGHGFKFFNVNPIDTTVANAAASAIEGALSASRTRNPALDQKLRICMMNLD